MTRFKDVEPFGILNGTKVLSTGSVTAEPFAATLFAEQGANVIHVESTLHPDDGRHPAMQWAQDGRNRRSLALNIPTPKGSEVFKRLIQWADLWMESSKGGTYAQWGFDDEMVRSLNPRIVIVHVSGYGQTGLNEYVKRPAYDPVAQAFSGYMHVNNTPDQKPAAVSTGIGDYITGLFTAWSAAAALLSAQKTGTGVTVDLAQYEALLRVSSYYPITYFTQGRELIKEPQSNEWGGFGTYRCADDRYVFVAMGPNAFIRRGKDILGLDADPNFPKNLTRIELNSPEADQVAHALERFCLKHSAPEVDRIFNDNNIACSIVLSYEDVQQHPHVQARDSLASWHDENTGQDVHGVGIVPHISSNPGKIWRGSAWYGQDNEDILEEMGYDASDIDQLYAQGVIKRNAPAGTRDHAH